MVAHERAGLRGNNLLFSKRLKALRKLLDILNCEIFWTVTYWDNRESTG